MHNRICNVEKCNRKSDALGMCNMHYQRHHYGKPIDPPAKIEYGTCTTDGCTKVTRSRYSPLCAMHYHRQYRHGSASITATETDVTASHGRRYKTKYAARHPLASKHGIVYVHRMVLFDAIGYGPHPCHWCHVPLNWTAKGEPDAIHVDHLNDIGDDNRIENLAVSCAGCNSARGAQHRHEALKVAGFWSQHDTIARLAKGRANRVNETVVA